MFSTNFALSLYDLVGHVIPGTFALLLFRQIFNINVPPELNNPLYLFITGFIAGSLLHAFGTVLFYRWYKEDYKDKLGLAKAISTVDKIVTKFQIFKVNPSSPDLKKQLWKTVNNKFNYQPAKETSVLLFQIADTITAASNFEERGLLLSKEAFYRSLTAFTVVVFPPLIWKYSSSWLTLSIIGLLLIEMLRYQREYYRRIKNNQIYIIALKELGNE